MKLKSLYTDRPWLQSNNPGVPDDVTVPLKSVGEVFDEATEKWKNKTAMVFYGRKVSYKELREKVDRLATALYDIGVRKGDRVAILLLNSPEHVISFYAVIKLGAIVTPISPVYISLEIKHQLEDSGAEHIICQDILYPAVEKTGVKFKNVIFSNISESLPVIKKMLGKSILRGVYQKMAAPSPKILLREGFYKLQELIQKYPPNAPKVEINVDEDLLTLPYTGGTTGAPKGVMITHRNVIASIMQYKAAQPFLKDGEEVTVGVAPFYHAGGQFTIVIFGIISGYTVLVLTSPDIDDVLFATYNEKASVFISAPTMFEILKDYEHTNRVNWNKLKVIYSGADALHENTSRGWEARTGVCLHESYGMTETVCITHCTPFGKKKTGSMGIPVPGTLAAILDPDKNEYQPIGELGELVVSGPQVTKGYWRNPEATKECEALLDGVRWWRTGDLARMDEDGYFYIYDRKRDLIKYKGLRIYAREVEEVLKNHSQIKEVGVVGVKDIKVGENVKAYVVLEGDARGILSESDIIEYCKDKLTPYKIPKIIEFVGEISKTDVGKVSRRELRELQV